MTKIIFISGIPSSGKSTFAKRLALEKHIDKVIDLDVLKSTCKLFVKNSDEPYLYTTSHEACNLEKLNIIKGFNKYCRCIQKYLIKLLNTLTKEKIVIVEGAQLTPEILKKLDKRKFCFEYITLIVNEETLKNRINEKLKIRQGNWLDNFENIITIQKYLIKVSKKFILKQND